MTVEWLLRALAVGALLGVAALAAERVAGWFALPRRWVWAAAMAGSLLLPALSLAAPGALPGLGLPAWARTARTVPAAARPADGGPGVDATAAVEGAAPAAPRSLPRGARLGWLAASLAVLGALGWSQRRLHAACGGCVARRVDGARVLVAERTGPLVLGLLHPQVVLPRWVLEAPAEERALVVRHEREHVRAGDAWLLALAALAVAALPWSPALWWQHRRLRLAVETDCDARVLAGGACRRLYGRVLLRTAALPSGLPSLALAWGGRASHLERRIVAMTNRRPRHRLLRALPFAALALGAAAAACGAAGGGADSVAAADTRTRVETWRGRLTATRDLRDGQSAVVWVGPAPGVGTTGMSYGWNERIVVVPGERPPPVRKTFPTVRRVAPGSPAAAAGLMVGDVILSSNGRSARLPRMFPDTRPGTEYTLRIRRGVEESEVRLVLGPPAPARVPNDAELDRFGREGRARTER